MTDPRRYSCRIVADASRFRAAIEQVERRLSLLSRKNVRSLMAKSVREVVLVRAVRQISFDCGCMAQETIKGAYEEVKGWVVIACPDHSNDADRKILSERADEEYNRATKRRG